MSDDARVSVAAYAVITSDGEVLLTRRRGREEWVLPGGSVKDREAPWEAVERELREETGLTVEVRRLVGVYSKREEHDLVFVFEAERVGGELRSSDERDRARFFHPDRLPDATEERHRERIDDALAGHENVVLAVQPSHGAGPSPGTR